MPSPRRAPPIRSPTRENPGPDLKSIAYELARDHDEELETVVVPTSKADLLLGIGRGLRELAGAGLILRILPWSPPRPPPGHREGMTYGSGPGSGVGVGVGRRTIRYGDAMDPDRPTPQRARGFLEERLR